tara:strand:- start:46045 stop:46902 length:858 start_codon:yes stop_codon:yes gene_type:complete
MKLRKYDALGNDYLILGPKESLTIPQPEQIQAWCSRQNGVGADGLLYGPIFQGDELGLRIFNPDGSEAEISGNGLRIFARYLWEQGIVTEGKAFTVSTLGGDVSCRVHDRGQVVSVQMGRVHFWSADIPVLGDSREVLEEDLELEGYKVRFCAATVGNPHCVVINQPVSWQHACKLGPSLETHSLFPNRTNVQFLEVIDSKTIRIEIWERGAGYTKASGSSSCAAAAVAHKLGHCGADIKVLMPGGALQVHLSSDYKATLTGPVDFVEELSVLPDGMLAQELAKV